LSHLVKRAERAGLLERHQVVIGVGGVRERLDPEHGGEDRGGRPDCVECPEVYVGKDGVTKYDSQLTRIDAAHDVGCAINPQGVEVQIQGGVTQAIGHTLMEEVKYFPNGDPQNAGFLDYKIPSILDLPLIEPVIAEEFDEEGLFDAHGIDEPQLLAMAPAIANAIEDAVGVRITSLPITAERVLQAVREQNRGRGRGSG
jgi:xanthine dehydrogenase molybdopterin-binding subunit B